MKFSLTENKKQVKQYDKLVNDCNLIGDKYNGLLRIDMDL